MTDEIPQAAKDYARKLIEEAKRLPHIVFAEEFVISRLVHENGLVPKEMDVLAQALLAADAQPIFKHHEAASAYLCAEIAKHGYAVVKVATDEERLIEARELCAMVAENLGWPSVATGYRKGVYDTSPEMIVMQAALKARDGVA